jgi:hypothetical protein
MRFTCRLKITDTVAYSRDPSTPGFRPTLSIGFESGDEAVSPVQGERSLCVSAKASFALAAVLIPVGVLCIAKARRRSPSLLPLSAMPLLFGIQQICEGLVWVGFEHDDQLLIRSAAIGFLFFALCFWLFWIPFSAVAAEKRRNRRFVFTIVAAIGLIGGVAAFVPIVMDSRALTVTASHHSIQYDITRAATFNVVPQVVWHLAYLAVIAFPLLASAEKELLGYNLALVLSAVVSHTYFWYSFESVWCFFAALLSLYIAWLFIRLPDAPHCMKSPFEKRGAATGSAIVH